MNKNTILLTQNEVESLINMDEAISVVEEAFRLYALGKAQMPPKVYLTFKSGDLRAMPAYLMNYAALKWVNSHPGNPERGLPTVMAILILNDPDTGFPLAVMDATYLTSIRTGAASGVASKYLARKDSKVFGFVGCGRQSYFQFDALRNIFEIELVKAYDINKSAMKRFSEHCEKLGFECKSCEIKEVCDCDVLTTTTPSNKPIVKLNWLNEGLHINAIGADGPGKQELEIDILKNAKIVVDDIEQSIHGGEINVAMSTGMLDRESIFATLGEVVAQLKPGRESYEEITIFDSTGLAIQDLAVAKVVFENAVKRKVGREIAFFDLNV